MVPNQTIVSAKFSNARYHIKHKILWLKVLRMLKIGYNLEPEIEMYQPKISIRTINLCVDAKPRLNLF